MDHEGGHGKNWSRSSGGGKGRALSLSAVPPLPVWGGGSPWLGAQWSHDSNLWGASVLANGDALNRQPWEAKGGVRSMHTHMPVLIIAVESTPPHSRPNRKQCSLEQTSTSCVCWGPFTKRPQSKSNVLSTASLSPSFRRDYYSFANSHKALFMLPALPKH